MTRLFWAAVLALSPLSATAHFVVPYTPDVQLGAPGDVPMGLIFWHPGDNGPAMDMEAIEAFFMIHKGEKVDLSERLTPTTFTGAENEAAAFRATIPVKRSGDYVVVTKPAPYFEASEDIYIQQITKVVLNRNGLPSDWAVPHGLEAEILPFTKPYNVIAGSSFTGQVLSDGAPVAGVEVEVEYLAALPDLGDFTVSAPVVGPMPGGAIVAITDANGMFTFGVPRAGWWGFAALGAGPVKDHAGKDMSQDAVLWIRAYEME